LDANDLQPILEQTMNEFGGTRTGFAIHLKNFDCFPPRVIFVHAEHSHLLFVYFRAIGTAFGKQQ
jgi:hypothetical protein